MQPKDRRLVTEQNLETYTETAIRPVRTRTDTALDRSEDAIERVEYIETMAGVSPGEVTDAQTASLITRNDTTTRAALEDTLIGRVSDPAQETASLGDELITDTGWSLGAGWSGNFADGFTHSPGETDPLIWEPPTTLDEGTYLVEWQYAGPAGVHQDVYAGYEVTLGDGDAGIIYQGAGTSNEFFSRAIRTHADGTLAITPWTTFEGRLHSIRVRRVTAAAAIPPATWQDAAGYRAGELRFGPSVQDSVFLGKDAGKYNITGRRNSAFGAYAMAANVSGFFNAALGYGALRSNVNGTRNVAVGYQALQLNESGDRNVGIGPFALTRLTTGQRNVAIGVDTLWRLEDGSDNIGIGYLTLTELRNSDHNIAIGRYAMRHTHGTTDGSTEHNIAIGFEALGHVLGEGNIAIGRRAAASTAGPSGVVAIGDHALEHSNERQQTAIGNEALQYSTGERNTAIGHTALRGVAGETTGERNVAIGNNAGRNVTSGSHNTIIGPSAGASLTTGDNNILIGFAADDRSANAGNFLNIGNVLYGLLDTQRFGIARSVPTARLHLGAGTAEPGGAPLKIDSGPLLSTPEAGTLEFSSGRLYFTTATGNRQEIAFV